MGSKKPRKIILFHITEIILSIIITGVLIIGVISVFNYFDNITVLKDEFDSVTQLLNLNPSNSSEIYRIIIIGDSVVQYECPNVNILEDRLNRYFREFVIDDRKISEFNVVNTGSIGGTIESLTEGIKIIYSDDIRVDMLFVFSGWNDHWYNRESNPCLKIGCYRNLRTSQWLFNLSKSDNRIIKNIATKYLIKQRDKSNIDCIALIRQNPEILLEGINHYDTSIYKVNLSSYEERLIEIIDLAREGQTELIFVTPPNALKQGVVLGISENDCALIDPKSYLNVHHLYVNKKREVARQYSVPVLDLEHSFRQINDFDRLFFKDAKVDGIHPNRLGNYYCTELYYQKILSTLLNQDISNINISIEQPYVFLQQIEAGKRGGMMYS